MAYKLYFSGALLQGVTQQEAARRIAELFGQPVETIEQRLFSGKLVRVKTVDDKEQARRLVAAFARAGAKLEVRRSDDEESVERQSPESGTPQAPPPIARPRKHMRWFLVASAAVVVAAVAAAWYTQPVWKSSPVSVEQLAASRALATDDLVALGHLDVERAAQLQARLFGAPDPDALTGDGENAWDGLVEAGIDPVESADDVIVALYAGSDGASWAMAIPGRPDAEALRRWIADRYGVDRFDEQTGTIYFSWLDETTCEPVPAKAARVGKTRVLFADAERLDAIWSRLENSAAADVDIDRWLAMTEQQVLTLGVFAPENVGQAADGMAGMMLAAAGQAASPAEALYFGVAPALLPPGVTLSGVVASNDQAFLGQAHTGATAWLDTARSNAAEGNPELGEIYDRISFSRDDRTFSAGIRLDTDLEDELQRLFGALFSGAFSSGPLQFSDSGMPVDEQVEENPASYADASVEQLKLYDSYGDGFFVPLWQQGPFAMTVSEVAISDLGRLEVMLKGEGRGLPNLGNNPALVRLRVSDVTSETGESLLPARECGGVRNREWTDAAMVSEGTNFVDYEVVRYPTATLQKKLALRDGASVADVADVRGEIEYRLPVRVRSVVVDAPFEGQVIEGTDIRVLLQEGTERSVSYQASGATERLLAVRALNANGQFLASGASTRGKNWIGRGEHASIDYYGVVAAVEVVLAEELQSLTYAFELPGAYPPIDSDRQRNWPPVRETAPAELEAALDLVAPVVEFPYRDPMATVVAGPGLLAVEHLQAASFMGLIAELDLYFSNEMPLAGQLNGASVTLDTARLEDGSEISLGLSAPVSLLHDGAYWMNGELTIDPERPWLKGGTTLQMSDYDADTPASIDGRIVLRAATDRLASFMAVAPGSKLDDQGLRATVRHWRENSLALEIEEGAERILSIEALGPDGQLVGRADSMDGAGGAGRANIELNGRPESLRISHASALVEHELPFTIATGP